ncbi:MAG: PIN domain-containing protein [Ilumatobacteraceae bacterium]
MLSYLDTSAVLALHLDVPARATVAAALGDTPCTSALALTEALALVDRLTDDELVRADIEDELRLQWDRYHVVPVDQRCLDRATVLMREQPLRLADALHLAAADRLPRPVSYVTLDAAQIPVALALGFDVVSP